MTQSGLSTSPPPASVRQGPCPQSLVATEEGGSSFRTALDLFAQTTAPSVPRGTKDRAETHGAPFILTRGTVGCGWRSRTRGSGDQPVGTYFIPTFTLLLTAGALARTGHISPLVVVAVAGGAAVVGDFLGHRIAPYSVLAACLWATAEAGRGYAAATSLHWTHGADHPDGSPEPVTSTRSGLSPERVD
ncbi:hypothetical protein [Streptomyces sp. NPDC021562]|uniref:hypothetical protein n=1 Tax=Streptomyces sp. NPDC021562 TaxID=3155121 RepID=UPI0034060230